MTEQEFKNEIKQLKDTIDDLEIKIDDKDSEIKTLQKKLEGVQNNATSAGEIKKLEEEKEQLETEKSDLESKVEKNSKSLKFINAILSDKTITNYEKLYENLTDIRNYLEDTLLDNIEQSTHFKELLNKTLLDDFDNWQAIERKQWLKNKRAIAFIGEFSSGKTSLINAILKDGVADSIQLPTSMKATTAIPTYICDTSINKTSYYFLDKENVTKPLTEDIFKIINHEVLENLGNIPSLLKYFIMEYSNPNLKNLTILDTPGFSNNKDDDNKTFEVINESDALFWVFDINAGEINRSSMNIIKKYLKKTLYIVINKVDTKSPGEIDKIEKHIIDTLKNNEIEYKDIIRFSNKDNKYLDKLKDKLKEIVSTNQYEPMYDVITKYKKNFYELYENTRDKLLKERDEEEKNINEARRRFNKNRDDIEDSINDLAQGISDIQGAIQGLKDASSKNFWGERVIDSDDFKDYRKQCKDNAEKLEQKILPNLREHIDAVIKSAEDYSGSLAKKREKNSSSGDSVETLYSEKNNIEKIFNKLLEKLSNFKSSDDSEDVKKPISVTKKSESSDSSSVADYLKYRNEAEDVKKPISVTKKSESSDSSSVADYLKYRNEAKDK